MSTSQNKYDAIERIIYTDNIRIESIRAMPDFDLILIKLNSGVILNKTLSHFPALKKLPEKSLNEYRLIGSGTGMHWPDADEDISLKGLLNDELLRVVGKNTEPLSI